MTQDRLETVASFSYLHEAELAKSCLAAEGIEAVIENENLIRLDWLYMNALGGLRVLVRETEAEHAREVLANPESFEIQGIETEIGGEACPHCGSNETLSVESRRKVSHLLWLFTGFPLVRPVHKRRCSGCGSVFVPQDSH